MYYHDPYSKFTVPEELNEELERIKEKLGYQYEIKVFKINHAYPVSYNNRDKYSIEIYDAEEEYKQIEGEYSSFDRIKRKTELFCAQDLLIDPKQLPYSNEYEGKCKKCKKHTYDYCYDCDYENPKSKWLNITCLTNQLYVVNRDNERIAKYKFVEK